MAHAAHRTKVGGKLTKQYQRYLREVLDRTATEGAFQRLLIACAIDNGWLVHHTPPAQVRKGTHVTPTQGHTGFPDLVLVRGSRFVVVELKSQRGTTSEMQDIWLGRLADCTIDSRLWRPSDWLTEIVPLLTGKS